MYLLLSQRSAIALIDYDCWIEEDISSAKYTDEPDSNIKYSGAGLTEQYAGGNIA